MRTTLVIEDELIVSAKKLAAEKGCSLSAVVAEALRSYVSNRERLVKRSTFHMPTFEGRGEKAIDSLPADFHRLDEEAELTAFRR